MKARTAEVSVKTRWEVEVFAHDTIYPTLVVGPPVASLNFNKAKQNTDAKSGITSIRVSRSKASPAGVCTFTTVGPPQANLFPGSWVVVSSINKVKGADRRLQRFVGQIYDMLPEYSVAGNAGITTRTVFQVREWSAMLEIPVRYDLLSVYSNLNKTPLAGLETYNAAITGKKEMSFGDYLSISVQNTFNPYELVHLFLALIGAINDDQKTNKIKLLGNLGLPEVAARLPDVPAALLARLGLEDVDTSKPYQTGFSDVITGIQESPANNSGSWNGVFAEKTGGDTTSLEQYIAKFKREVTNRPISLGLAALAGIASSAWSLITRYCDPALNEFYTDILYQYGPGGESDIVAKPAMFVRDKPFLMKKLLKDPLGQKLKDWTRYDDLPRVRLDTVYIERMRLKNTFMNSPNFIQVNFQPHGNDNLYAKSLSELYGKTIRSGEMNRFGAIEHFLETSFLSLGQAIGGKSDFSHWFQELAIVSQGWHAFNYRMMSGTLTLRDDNVPLTCGFNTQFTIGEWELVGHVESVDISFGIDVNGQFETTTNLQLSRVVQDVGGELDFIPPQAMCDLFHTPQSISEPVTILTPPIAPGL